MRGGREWTSPSLTEREGRGSPHLHVWLLILLASRARAEHCAYLYHYLLELSKTERSPKDWNAPISQ